jgi:hypothetical protein
MQASPISHWPATIKALLLAAAISALLPAHAAMAQRPSTLNMTCGQARSLVASRGTVVLSTGAHTFDKYVASPGYCLFGEYAYSASVPTRDTRNCRIGYRCDSNPPLWDNGIFGGPLWRH